MDTGGITESKEHFARLIREQVREFLHLADILLVIVDGRAGCLPEDHDIVRLAHATGRPFLVVVNKVDRAHEADAKVAEFYELGASDVVATSFETRGGVTQLLEWLHEKLPDAKLAEVVDATRVAVVGKPNAGKSSLINAILGEKRMIVSEVAGTTVDAVDTPFEISGLPFVLVDTAGLRKSARREDHLEIISAFKSQEAIRRSEIVLLVVDATIGPTEQDAKILAQIIEGHKGVLLVANKVDLARELTPEHKKVFREQVERVFHFFPDIPVVFTSALEGWGMSDLLSRLAWLSERLRMRIGTRELNDFFFQVIRQAPAPVYGIHNVKFYYLTQTKQRPPSFIAFANHPDGVDDSYRRFLMKRMKKEFDLEGVPLRIFVMKSGGPS